MMNATLEIEPGLQASHSPRNQAWWGKARSLKFEMALAFGIVTALLLALGLTFFVNEQRSSAALDMLLNDSRIADLSVHSELAMAKAVYAQTDFLLSLSRVRVTRGERSLVPMQAQISELREHLASARSVSADPDFRGQIDRINQQVQHYEESFLAFANQYEMSQIGTLYEVDQRFDAVADAIAFALDELHAAATKRTVLTHSGVERGAQIARWIVFGLGALALLIGGGVALFVWRRINGSVSELIAFSRRVAAGDLGARAPQGSEDEFNILARAMNQMAQSLQNSQTQLRASARQAGMAEIATNVLHNVGNILNSVNVSAALVTSTLRTSRARGLTQAIQLMDEHAADLGDFLTLDAKGKLLPGYLNGIALALAQEQQRMIEELAQLTSSVDHIKSVVSTQQSYAVGSSVVEPVQISELAEEALRLHGESLARHHITVVREFAPVPLALVDRARVLQILVNLISNAKNAMEDVQDAPRRLTLRVDVAAGSRLRIQVQDEGDGIPAQNLTRIFAHGFTTRKNGHGFGLHSCALTASQMNGSLSAHSDGPGRGATFTLEFPIHSSEHALNTAPAGSGPRQPLPHENRIERPLTGMTS